MASGSLGALAINAVSRDGLRGNRAVLNGAESHNRAVGQMGAILVAIVVTAGAGHRQGTVVTSRGLAVQELAHALAEVARQEGVQQRVQAGVHVRDEEGRHGQ